MTIHVPIPPQRRRIPLASSRTMRLRILTENAINAFLDEAIARDERNDRAEDLIDIVRSYINDVPTTLRHDATTLRQITKNIIRMYLGDGGNQKERVRRADALTAVIKVYMRREAR